MSRLSLSDMGIDLTSELASLMRLSVSDKWFIGKSFIFEFSNAILSNDIRKIRALVETYSHMDYPPSEKLSLRFEKEFLSVFNALKNKLRPINSLSVLIQWLEVEYDYNGWGDVFISHFNKLKSKGIDFINLDYFPYRYADEFKPLVDLWCDEELIKNECPFVEENAIDYFYEFVNKVRGIEFTQYDSELYCFTSASKGLRILDRKSETYIR
ncbi:TPA: hypothetical protein U5D50_004259 [Yersinia enterocolitica]|nr:hypothetical protein [Yersinia enterocolitica]